MAELIPAEAVLFDMDGTLVDSTAVVEAIWREFAERYAVDPAAVLGFAHGRPTQSTVDRFLPPGPERGAVLRRLAREETERLDGVVAVPGAGPLLAGLAGLPVALVTSASHRLAAVRMAAAGLPMPEVLVSPEDVSAGKPSPEGYLSAAARLGVPIDRCLVFEDADAGLQAGLASGARVVVVGANDSEVAAGLRRVDLRDLSVVRSGTALRGFAHDGG